MICAAAFALAGLLGCWALCRDYRRRITALHLECAVLARENELMREGLREITAFLRAAR